MPIFSHVIYNRLMEQIAVWDTTRIEKVLAEKFNNLINANKEKWISQVNYAKENYDVTVIFQAIVSYDDAGINISIERNDFPLELYYSDKRDVKLRVLTYKGEIAFVDYNFSGLMIGIAKKEEKAFNYIKERNPDVILMIEYHSDFEPLGLADFFSTIVCADDTDEHKPKAAPLVAYLAKAHINPENALYIGDSIYDIQCADNAGVDSGLVLWSNNVSNPIRADYYFKTPHDISKIL